MVKVDKIIPGGQALGTLDNGKKIFFWNALPGEIVSEYRITKNKSHYIEAIATKIENPSPFRMIRLTSTYFVLVAIISPVWCFNCLIQHIININKKFPKRSFG